MRKNSSDVTKNKHDARQSADFSFIKGLRVMLINDAEAVACLINKHLYGEIFRPSSKKLEKHLCDTCVNLLERKHSSAIHQLETFQKRSSSVVDYLLSHFVVSAFTVWFLNFFIIGEIAFSVQKQHSDKVQKIFLWPSKAMAVQ